MLNLDECKTVINDIYIDKKDLSYNEANKYNYIMYDIYDSITQKIKYHDFCIIFWEMGSVEVKKAIESIISYSKSIIQKSIDSNTVDIDFPGWDQKIIIIHKYIVKGDDNLIGLDTGLNSDKTLKCVPDIISDTRKNEEKRIRKKNNGRKTM